MQACWNYVCSEKTAEDSRVGRGRLTEPRLIQYRAFIRHCQSIELVWPCEADGLPRTDRLTQRSRQQKICHVRR